MKTKSMLKLFAGLLLLSKRRMARALVASAALALDLVCLCANASVVISFEDLPASGNGTGGLSVGNQYASLGITFNFPTALDFSQGTPAIPGFAHSGTKAIEICYGIEFCGNKLQMDFTCAQTHVKVWVGYEYNSLSSAQTVIMRAYNSGGAQVATGTATLGPSDTYYIPIQTPLEVNVGSASLPRVTVGFLGAEGGNPSIFNNGLCFDDVEFDQGPPPPCPSTHNPALQVTKPASGTVVQANEFILDYTATTPDPFAQVTLIATGPNSATRSATYYFSGHFGPVAEDGFLFPGVNQLAITVTDCYGSTTTTRTIEYDPTDPSTRLQVMGIEITQAIQDLHSSVPMIADKRTFARVYVRSEGPTTEIRNVTGWLRACRPDGAGLICLSGLGSSVQSLNTITVDTSSDVTAKRRDLNASLNFELPPDWIVAGNLHVEVTLRAPGADFLACDGCNNPDRWGAKAFVQFQTAPPLFLQIVNLNYMRTMGGICCTLFSPNQSDADNLTSLLRRLYPVSTISSG